MIKVKTKLILASVLSASLITPILSTTAMAATTDSKTNDVYAQRFLEQRNKISNPDNGYFREITKNGKTLKVPYHSVETFMVEAPDYGHETTSEAYSYYMWLEAMYGKFTGDWSEFESAWDSADAYIIPHGTDQQGMDSYNPSSPATLANEYTDQTKYPSQMQFNSGKTGQDPISNELKSAYGSSEIYGMHWLLDVDNWYGFGNRGDGKNTDPSYINTYQRGSSESCFETVPQPSWDAFNYGGKNGFLDLFTGDSNYSKQWKYTNAPDADARAIQATYWANEWAEEDGTKDGSNLDTYVSKASKMGDYLRYSMFDKYFRNIGVASNGEDQGTNQHYLMSWYYAWGGSAGQYPWSWKIACSHNHFGYQNPMAAWILSNNSEFKPKSQNGQSDWSKSLERQMEFYEWLQSSEGAIAGGATNSYTTDQGSYQQYPEGTSTFYGMAYDEAPVYRDPDSNNWFGMQVWSMQRVAELYYRTGNERAERVLDKWVKWIEGNVKENANGTYDVPSTLSWDGQPDKWTGTSTGNPDLHCTVKEYAHSDVGTASSLANTLLYYSKGKEVNTGKVDEASKELAEGVLDGMWNNYQDEIGLSTEEAMTSYDRIFNQDVYIPQGWSGKMPNGDEIKPGIKFIDIRSKYKQDPDYARVKEAVEKGEDPTFRYHRFWAQSEIAIANGTHAVLFPDVTPIVTSGDVNGDGEVNQVDFILLRKYLKNTSITINEANADVNEDGTINVLDLVALKKLI